MEAQPELSLGPVSLGGAFAAAVAKSGKSSSSSESDSSSSSGGGGVAKKRKHLTSWEEAVSYSHASLELQLTDPLPLDWEQCLDLHSGRMYYLNRKTMKKSWTRPREEQAGGALNLELNISTIPSSFADGMASSFAAGADDDDAAKSIMSSVGSAGQYMVAVPCANCHLLVMLCKSSPACPNCKFVQPSVPAATTPPPTSPRRLDAVKPLETLSLLH